MQASRMEIVMSDQVWRGKVGRMMPMVIAFNEAIIQLSNPRDDVMTNHGMHGALVAYHSDEVLAALMWVAAGVAVQSGDFPTSRERKVLVREMGDQFRQMCSEIDEQLKTTSIKPWAEAMALAKDAPANLN